VKLLRFLTKRFFLSVYAIVTLLFLLACLAPYVNPARFWPLAFFGLAFPFIAATELLFLLMWLFFDPKWSLLSLVIMLIGWKPLTTFFAWHFSPSSKIIKTPETIRVMSYNVHYFRPYNDKFDKGNVVRKEILQLIQKENPDILCLEEFFTSEDPRFFDFKSYISDSMGFPYRYFSSDYNALYSNNHSGVILFSKYPFIDAEKIKLQHQSNSESAVVADIVKGNDTFRVYTMHLQSIYLNWNDLKNIQRIKEREDSGLLASRTILGKLKRAFIRRGKEVDLIAAAIRKSPYPVIVCGDFNDTPDSYTYFKIRGDLQDAFLKKGAGIGATYMSISPTLRIDYIFADNHWRVDDFYRIKRQLSDHYPVISDLSFKE
jgi:endonuclease/exonuclease/phosphatase family metal-dependent hydrolase